MIIYFYAGKDTQKNSELNSVYHETASLWLLISIHLIAKSYRISRNKPLLNNNTPGLLNRISRVYCLCTIVFFLLKT